MAGGFIRFERFGGEAMKSAHAVSFLTFLPPSK
jgi:hypothetical protein